VYAEKAPVYVGYYNERTKNDLLQHFRIPRDRAQLYMGTYGLNAEEHDQIKKVGGVYAPIVGPHAKYNPRRRLSQQEAASCGASCSKSFEGLPTAAQRRQNPYAWGLEMGRRSRDRFRSFARSGRPISSFQFDEIYPSASKAATRDRTLTYLTGALDGMRQGRPELGDKPMRGAVHVAHPGQVARLPDSRITRRFWKSLNKSTNHLILEQYVPFKGSPQKRAERDLDPVQTMRRSKNPNMRALSRRYVAGLTPGMRKGLHLGGRSKGQSDKAAHAWRQAYMRSLQQKGAKGVSFYNWTGPGNTRTKNIRAIARQVRTETRGKHSKKTNTRK